MLVRALMLGLMLTAATAGADEPAGADAAPAAWRFDLGLGVAARWQREINPAYGEWTVGPQPFATAWYRRFGLSFDFGREAVRDSRSGGLNIHTEGVRFGAWGRYAYGQWGQVTAYGSLGGGAAVETIRTTFLNATDQRRGSRRFVGLGAGFNTRLYTYLLVEAEGRVLSEETVKSPGVMFVIRVGVGF